MRLILRSENSVSAWESGRCRALPWDDTREVYVARKANEALGSSVVLGEIEVYLNSRDSRLDEAT